VEKESESLIRVSLRAIKDRLKHSNQYRVNEVSEFVEQLGLLDQDEQIGTCFELPRAFFPIIAQQPLIHKLASFLAIYERLVERQDYSWSYAEDIASKMRDIFRSDAASFEDKTFALDLAIRAASYKNRFAAMDTCRAMVKSVVDDALGMHIASLLIKYKSEFIVDIEPSECKSIPIKNALRQIRQG